jgi:nucleoside-diphosphate-sugar epimerase
MRAAAPKKDTRALVQPRKSLRRDHFVSIYRHVVVTGGAGFIGSHLCRALLDGGDRVTAIDNLCTGNYDNIRAIVDRPGFGFREADITSTDAYAGLTGVTHVAHLACPASPRANSAMPVETIRAASVGTLNALEFAARYNARIIVASSSEIYGDPQVHPQREDYRGNTDLVGRFAAYTEGKRVTEAAAAVHQRMGTNCGIVRPFNAYGPLMWPDDGRAVSSFCAAALRDEVLRIDGGGRQTRSFVYIADMVDALTAMLDSDAFGPVNIGSEDEITIAELAELVVEMAGRGRLEIAPARDFQVNVRRPDTTRIRELLGWHATTPLREGLSRTLDWMADVLAPTGGRVVSP